MGSCFCTTVIPFQETPLGVSVTDSKQWSKDWNVPTSMIEEAYHQASALCLTNDNHLRAVFFLSKQIHTDILEEAFLVAQREYFELHPLSKLSQSLSIPKNILQWWTESTHAVAMQTQSTLDRLLDRHGDDQLQTTPVAVSFQTFETHHPEWASIRSFVFFRDHRAVRGHPGVLIQRRQLSGPCCIHGAVVAHHYIMCLYFGSARTVDIEAFVRRNMDSNLLAKLLCRAGGASSVEVFQQLLTNPMLSIVNDFDKVRSCLECYGPGVVSGFRIEPRFHSAAWSFDGTFFGPSVSAHSMVLVGVREDVHGKKWVLLQNWWLGKQFLECDETYFKSAGATVSFATEIQEIRSDIVMCSSEWAETSVDFRDFQNEEF